MYRRRPSPLFLALPIALVGCHPGPSELGNDAGTPAHEGHRREVHRILERDHRHVIPLRVGDEVVLPDDPAFDWSVTFEDPSGFERVAGVSQRREDEAYRMTKAGPFRMMIFGEPKCLKTDPKCGTSKRRWDVTVTVQ